MWLLIVEALIALGMLGFIVWWTMFAGRQKGEIRGEIRGEVRGEIGGGDSKENAEKADEPPR
jgi:hypothetical protein